MPINMTDYKMIIHERIYNVLQIVIDFGNEPTKGVNAPKPKYINAVYIDEDGVIRTIRDAVECFQFIRKMEF